MSADRRVPRIADAAATYTPSDGGDPIVFDDVARRWHRLPGTAAPIWAAIDGVRDVEAVTAVVAEIYSVEARDIRADVEGLIDRLHAEGLLAGVEMP